MPGNVMLDSTSTGSHSYDAGYTHGYVLVMSHGYDSGYVHSYDAEYVLKTWRFDDLMTLTKQRF